MYLDLPRVIAGVLLGIISAFIMKIAYSYYRKLNEPGKN